MEETKHLAIHLWYRMDCVVICCNHFFLCLSFLHDFTFLPPSTWQLDCSNSTQAKLFGFQTLWRDNLGYSTAFLRVWVRLSASKATKNNRNAVTRERTETTAGRDGSLPITRNVSPLLACGVFKEKIKIKSRRDGRKKKGRATLEHERLLTIPKMMCHSVTACSNQQKYWPHLHFILFSLSYKEWAEGALSYKFFIFEESKH